MSRVSWVATGSATDPCCCECCMYSAQGIVDASFTNDDIPAAVTASETSLPKVSTDESEWRYESGGLSVWTNPTSGGIWFYEDGICEGPRESPCLFGKYVRVPFDEFEPPCAEVEVEDQFAATYSVTGTLTGTVTRSSLCDWLATGITLKFNFASQRWNVNGNEKSSGNQSSPVGSYNGGFAVA